MPRDGEGKHAIWEQVFILPNIKAHLDTEICLEGHDGSPLDSKLIASTNPWRPRDLLKDNHVVVGGELAVKELDMF